MRNRFLARGVAAVAATVMAGGVTFGFAGSAGAAGITVKPSSNLAVGGGTYVATVTAPKNTFPRVPDPAATPSARTATTKLASAVLTGTAGTFTVADIGMFVDDGVGGRVLDGVDVTPITPLVAVYPRQGLAYIKAVSLTGNTATMSKPAIAAGAGSVNLIAPAVAILLVTQSTASIPFIVPAIPGPGLCASPLFVGGVCNYDIGNLAMSATKKVVFANPDGSMATPAITAADPFVITEGVMDGALGTNPGPVFVRSFDPDGGGPYGVLPFGVPSDDPGATPRGCAPDSQDRSIPNAGGVDYCMVTAIGLNAGVQTTHVPFQLSLFPLTWAASAGGFAGSGALVITGANFANNDVITKIIISNAKAKVTGSPLVKCPALNQTILGGVTASATGGVLTGVADYLTGCTVPAGSVTRVTIIGTKDVQLSQIPPNAAIGTSLPKQAIALITMP